LGGIVPDVEPLVLPSGDIRGKFVKKVFVTSMLPKMDAGAPYHRWVIRGRLCLDMEKIAEKIPMGFDSEESFAEVNEDRDVEDRVWVEVLELNPVKVKKATEERTGGEGQTPFRKVVE
jgi:hypothetical protein